MRPRAVYAQPVTWRAASSRERGAQVSSRHGDRPAFEAVLWDPRWEADASATALLACLVVGAVSATSLGGVRGAHDHLGYAVAAGDFDGDGDAELAVGAPDEDAGPVDSGAVYFHE